MRKELVNAEELWNKTKESRSIWKTPLKSAKNKTKRWHGELERKQADMEVEKASTQLEMEKQRQQVQLDQEKLERETQRQKIDFEKQMKLLEPKRQADSDTFELDIELPRIEHQQVLDDQRLQMEAAHHANNHAASTVHRKRERCLSRTFACRS